MRSTCVAPAAAETTAPRRRGWAGPDEVPPVILFLASDAASLMTCIVLADGGYTCW